jgi:hypothetical protein
MPDNKGADIISWDFILSGIEDQEGIGEEEKKEIIQNWQQLRITLGEEWLKENADHLLRAYLLNRAPWSIRWVSELGFGIGALKNKANFDNILERLRSSRSFDQFYAAYYELWVALSLLKSGIPFEFLKPAKKMKTPDIKIISDIRPLFLEVTKKNAPEKYVHASKNYHKVWYHLSSKTSGKDLDFCCDLQRVLSTPRAEKVMKETDKLVEQVTVSGFEHYQEDKIDIYIFKKENGNLVPEEKRVNQGIMPGFDEILRISGTIEEKAPQLENHAPGVLMVFDDLFWPYEIEPFYKNLIDKLVATVEEHSKLSALVLYIETSRAFNDESFIKTGNNYIAIKGYDEALQRPKNKVIILNEFADCTLLHDEIEILKTI